MKRKTIIAVIMVAILTIGAIGVFALAENASEGTISVTARFFVEESSTEGSVFTMVSADGEYQVRVTDDTAIYFEGYVPLSDECDEVTKVVREVLFGRTLLEVLEGRNMTVTFVDGAQAEAISVVILFEMAVHLPTEISDADDFAKDGEYACIVTLPGVID